MAKPIGKMFAEIDLDSTRLEQGLKKTHKMLKNGTIKVEDAYKQIGMKSDQVYAMMRSNARKSLDFIKNKTLSSKSEIVRAERATADKIRRINEQQFGRQTSALSKLKKNWMGTTAAIVAAWYGVRRVVGAAAGVVMAAARYETLGVVMRVVGKNAGYSADQMEAFAKGLQSTGIAMSHSRQVLTVMAQAQIDLNKATALGRIAQDAAVIGNINSSEALKSLIHGIHTANVRVLRTIGIQVSWEQSYLKAAKAMGRTVNSLTLQEKAQIRVNAVLEAGTRIQGSYEAAMETAGKKVLSFQRHWDNLKVVVGKVFTPALAMGVDLLTASVKSLTAAMEGMNVATSPLANFQAQATTYAAQIKLIEDSIRPGAPYLPAEDKFTLAKRLPMLRQQLKIVQSSIERESRAGGWNLADPPLGGGPKTPADPTGLTTKEINNAKWLRGIRKKAFDDDARDIAKIAKLEWEMGEKSRKQEESNTEWLAGIRKKAYDDDVKDLQTIARLEWEMGEKAADDAKQLAGDRADANKTMLRDMKGDAASYYKYQLRALDKQRAEYETLVGKNTVTDAWYLRKKKKLDQELTLSSNKFFAGIKVGYDQSRESAMTFAQTGKDTFDSFTNEVSSSLSDNFFNIFTGRMDELALDWESMWQGMARTASDRLAQIATDKALDVAISGVDWLGTAMGWWSSGAWDIKKDQMAVLHKGEMVVPASEAGRIRGGEGTQPDLGVPWGDTGRSAFSEAAVQSLASYGKGLAVGKAVGWAITGAISPVIGPLGFAGALALSAYRGYKAEKEFQAAAGIGMGGGGGPEGMGMGLGAEEGMAGMTARGGWWEGPKSGYGAKLHGKELVLNEDQVKAVREVNAGGGGETHFHFSGIFTTDDAAAWVSEMQQKIKDDRIGTQYKTSDISTAGLSI